MFIQAIQFQQQIYLCMLKQLIIIFLGLNSIQIVIYRLKKLQYMKIVDDTVNVQLITRKLNTKIQYLSRSIDETEKYKRDLEFATKINKSIINDLQQRTPNYEELISHFEQENYILKDRLKRENKIFSEGTIDCDEKTKNRQYQKEFYENRMKDLQTKINQLRQSMLEKEASFKGLVQKLNKYEEIEWPTLISKLENLNFSVQQNFITKLISKLSGQNLKLQKESILIKKELQQYKNEIEIIKKTLNSPMNFYRLKESILNSEQIPKKLSLNSKKKVEANQFEEERKMMKELATNQKINKQFIRLIKKQRIANQMLERQFKQSVEINEEILNWNSVLSNSNQSKQHQIAVKRAKITKMEQQLQKLQTHFYKLRKAKSQNQLKYNYCYLIQDKANHIILSQLKKEIKQIPFQNAVAGHFYRSQSCHIVYSIKNDEDFFDKIMEF